MNAFTRNDLHTHLQRFYPGGSGVEVGVAAGEHAGQLLDRWNCRELHLVDAWNEATPGLQGTGHLHCADRDYPAALELVERYPGRVHLHRKTSAAAAPDFAGRGLEFAFLDAGHGYADIRRDLLDWYPAVRPGGLFAGHDYTFGYFYDGDLARGWHCGVQPAVDRFCADRGLIPRYTFRDVWPSWYVWKPAHQSPLSIAVHSAATPGYPGSDFAERNHARYSARHGFSYRMGSPPTEPHWHKVRVFADLVRSGDRSADWFFWIDADALFMNWEKSVAGLIQGSPFNMIVGWHDRWGVNTGVFAIKNCDSSLPLLERWLSLFDRHCTADTTYDNSALQQLIDSGDPVAAGIEVVSHRLLNSYPQFGEYGPSDFIAHFPGSGPRRADLMRHFSAMADDWSGQSADA